MIIYIYIKDLDTVFIYCFLNLFFKILLCGFFMWNLIGCRERIRREKDNNVEEDESGSNWQWD